MARGTWSIYTKNSAGAWEADTAIYRPNENLDVGLSSTHTRVKLADGTNAFVVPETSYDNDALSFVWRGIVVADGLIAQIEGYISNDDEIKIITHLSHEYIGRFSNITKTHAVGQDDIWDVEANFDRL